MYANDGYERWYFVFVELWELRLVLVINGMGTQNHDGVYVKEGI